MTYIAVVMCAVLLRSLPPFSLEMADLNSNKEKLAKCLYAIQTNIAYTAFIEIVYVAIPFILIILCYVKVFYTVPSTNRIFQQRTTSYVKSKNRRTGESY